MTHDVSSDPQHETSLKLAHTVLMHCAKSYRPVELFVSANYKLQNEAKMNAIFERGSARDASA